MKDGSIKLNLINGRVSMECGQAELEVVAVMCGAMQALLAYECYRRFDEVDDVRNYMLDLHLSAMDDFMVYVERGGINDQERDKTESRNKEEPPGKGNPSAEQKETEPEEVYR